MAASEETGALQQDEEDVQSATEREASARWCPVVGIGASAGGVEALETLFKNMPPDPGAAFVIVVHLDPNRPSMLAELLGRLTSMPVAPVKHGIAIQLNQVYVITPNTLLHIEGGLLVTLPRSEAREGLIDAFFRSLAEEQGEAAVGIVLSGTGTDGTVGLRAIKEHGGMTMVQAVESAKYDSMPRSAIAAGLVDWVLPAEELPGKLAEYLAQQKASRTSRDVELLGAGTEEEVESKLREVYASLHRATGNDFSHYKRSTFVRRILRRMDVLRVRSLAEYLVILDDTPEEAERLFQDLLISVTHFFRDPEAFDVLAREVVPKILKGRGEDDPVRVWVPGCATGEEAFSIAILLAEASPAGVPPVKVFATDIDERALLVARAAQYSKRIAEQVSPERLERFFVSQNGVFQVRKQIRDLCIFASHNVISDPPFSRLDLVSCRNLLIYLDTHLQRVVFPLFHYGLRQGGYLFLGPSENVTASPALFNMIDKKHRILQRKDVVSAVPLPSGMMRRFGVQAIETVRRQSLGRPGGEARTVLESLLLAEYTPSALVVDAAGTILFISGRTGKYLELMPGAASVNALEMARRELRADLHAALYKAMKTKEECVHAGIPFETEGRIQPVDVIVRPVADFMGRSDLFLVVFRDVGPALDKERAAATGVVPRSEDGIVQTLETELRSTKEHLRSTIEELEASNEELRSTNEELQSSNEELQSSNEELQTSKEELQSINEELHTVNAELVAKIDELDKASTDLSNLFASTRIATIFLGKDLRIKRFSPEATEIFRLVDADVGRPITDITTTVTDADLVAEAQRVLATLVPAEQQVRKTDADVWFLRRIRPYRSIEDAISGVVVTFVDVTELKLAQERASRLAAIVESSQEAIVGMSLEREITSWNRGAERMLGYSSAEALGRSFEVLLPSEVRRSFGGWVAEIRAGEVVEPLDGVGLIRKDGTSVQAVLGLSAVLGEGSSPIGISAIAHDLTERNRMTQAVDADRRKSEFLAILAHELRNPLAPIRNAVQVLREAPAGSPAATAAREVIDRQIMHMARLIDDLLDVSRIARGKVLLRKERLDLIDLVRATAQDYQAQAEAGRVSLAIGLPAAPLWLDGDPTRLSQIVGNLLGNAIKFTDPGGRVSVGVELPPEGKVALIRVRDTGIGLDRETLARAFEPFTQGQRSLDHSRGGLGLGLSLVRAMVELHGGTVEAESGGAGRGATFTLCLPLPQAPLSPRRPAAAPAAGSSEHPQHVLIIEDNQDAAESLRLLLELWGHDVAVASSGAEGVQMAIAQPPDVVLCDISLSDGVDGYEVARSLRADPATSSAQIIAMTGYGTAEDQQRSIDAGFDKHLTKPVDPDTLRALLALPFARPAR